MIERVRKFIYRIVDTRVREAVIALHRSMQHLDINADERHKAIMSALEQNSPVVAAVPPGVGTKTPSLGAELKSVYLRESQEWRKTNADLQRLFIAQVKGMFAKDANNVQADFEERYWKHFYPTIVMLDNVRGRTIGEIKEEYL